MWWGFGRTSSTIGVIMTNRDDFKKTVVDALAKRAAYHCSNPDCVRLTLEPSVANTDCYIYTGQASHITAASTGGPRYDSYLSSDQRQSADNGIFLCSECGVKIDKNDGVDFSVEKLREWKSQHEELVKTNGSLLKYQSVFVVAGEPDVALEVNADGADTIGRILKPGAEEVIHGSQRITASNGAIGEIVDQARKTIISEGGSNPALSVNVINGGQGFVSRTVIDENGVHGGVRIVKIIK
jgi:hypothetical protein